MKKKRQRCNLETIFAVSEIASDSQMREILDGAEIEVLREMLPEVFERMHRLEWTLNYTTELSQQRYYLVILDGSQYFSSHKISCPGCLRKTGKDGQVHYRHVVVSATIVKAGTHSLLPLDVEEVRNEDGYDKQDCEINASKRMLERMRQEHPQMKI